MFYYKGKYKHNEKGRFYTYKSQEPYEIGETVVVETGTEDKLKEVKFVVYDFADMITEEGKATEQGFSIKYIKRKLTEEELQEMESENLKGGLHNGIKN